MLHKHKFPEKTGKKKPKSLNNLENAQDILVTEAELGILPEIVSQCFGMSKMIIENDLKDRK